MSSAQISKDVLDSPPAQQNLKYPAPASLLSHLEKLQSNPDHWTALTNNCMYNPALHPGKSERRQQDL
jgi:hypothetical protein